MRQPEFSFAPAARRLSFCLHPSLCLSTLLAPTRLADHPPFSFAANSICLALVLALRSSGMTPRVPPGTPHPVAPRNSHSFSNRLRSFPNPRSHFQVILSRCSNHACESCICCAIRRCARRRIERVNARRLNACICMCVPTQHR